MFDAGSISSSLGLDLSEFSKGFIQADALMQIFPQSVTTFLASPLLALIDVAKQAASAVVDAFLEIGNAADNAGKAAERFGVSVEFLTGVGAVAADAGSSIEGLGTAMKFLNNAAGDAFSGNEKALKSFENLGVGVLDAGGKIKSSETLFFQVADAIAALPTAAQKTQAAMDLLGRGGTDLIPTLNKGASGIQALADQVAGLGGTIDGDLAGMGDKFGTLSTLIDAAWKGVKKELAQPILAFVAEHFDEIVQGITSGAAFIREAIQAIAPIVGGVWDAFKGLANLVGSVVTPIFQALKPVLEVIGKVLQTIFEVIGKILSGIGDAIRGITDFFGITEKGGEDLAAAAGGKKAGGTTVNVGKVEVQAFDSAAASSELAKKIHAPLREKTEKEKKKVEAHYVQEFVLMAL